MDDLPGSVNVLLVGGGGREHALAWKLRQSPRLGQLWVTDASNPGLRALGTPVDVPVDYAKPYRLEQFCRHKEIGLVVIGPEDPLAAGLADALSAPAGGGGAGRCVFGPVQDAARLEADKAWCKQILRGASIPTAEARTFTDVNAARRYLESRIVDDAVLSALFESADKIRNGDERWRRILQTAKLEPSVARAFDEPRDDLPVIKAAGLARGKGVVVPETFREAAAALDRMMVKREFGEAGRQVLLEEKLEGREVSVLALVDGRNIFVLEPCQDHKRLRDGDEGPNTGGMGAFCPGGLYGTEQDEQLLRTIERDILVPTVDALRREGIEYRGVLYAGIMLTPGGPKVLEFNVRFGDPECQALMARLDADLIEVMLATCAGRLDEVQIDWKPGASCCLVLAAEGYPDSPRAGDAIEGLEEAERVRNVTVFHAGTRRSGEDIVTAGGRVLNVTATGRTLDDARDAAYAAADMIRFRGKTMRRDIARPSAVPSA